MRLRLLISVLVLALSGANSGATAICAAYCMSPASAVSAVVHHVQVETQPSPASISHHTHTRHHGAPCADCPITSQYSLNQKADCASLVQIQALKEGSFSLDAPNRVAQIEIAGAPAEAFSLASDRERYLVFDTSPAIRSFNPASLPLRI